MQIAIRAYGSAISGSVSDPTINAIDRLFDLVDRGVDHVDRVLNRNKHTQENAEKVRTRRRRAEVIEAESVTKQDARKSSPKAAPAAAPAALVRKPHFYIVESSTPAGTLFVVTDGGNARTECSTREFAEKILRALEAA